MMVADDAFFYALNTIFTKRNQNRPQHLMCFFLFMMNVKEHTSKLTKIEKRLAKDVIYDMLFAANEF